MLQVTIPNKEIKSRHHKLTMINCSSSLILRFLIPKFTKNVSPKTPESF